MSSRNIIVTGASNGVGYQSALELSRNGNRVFALARNGSALARLKAEAAKAGGEVVAMEMDLADGASRTQACQAVAEQAGKIDVLIHNAGYLVNKPFSELSGEEWLAIYQVNVFGAADVTRQLLPVLQRGSHVVHISSMGGVQGSVKFPGLSAYSSAKGALATLAECLAEEFRGLGIAVNCLALGSVQTDMFARAFPGMSAALSVKEASEFVAFFAINGHKYFNGKILPVSAATP